MVSTYHYISWDPGRLYRTHGKSEPSDMFSGGCVFIDLASGYVIINHQLAINATEIIKKKHNFEREDKSQGVIINLYYTDNGIFNTPKFVEEMMKKQQKIRCVGLVPHIKMGQQSMPSICW